jgi:hypothetical protein
MKKFRDFESAREFARALKLKGNQEWREYCKSGNKPNDIPVNPNRIYKKDFKGFGDWVGTGTIRTQDRVYRSFTEAREFVRKLGLKSNREWLDYCKSGNKPDNIPATPENTYKNKGWQGFGDWLGNGTTRNFRPFKEAREFVRALGFKKINEWRTYCKSGNKPNNIPADPWKTYKNQGWIEVGDWLGSGRTRQYRTYKEAREFVRSLNLKGKQEWMDYCKSGNKPDDIPANPWSVYKEWKKK